MEFERPFHSGLRDGFSDHFGASPQAGARAPGRVNLIGEHTDYSEGFVLPFAIDRETWVLASRGRSAPGPFRVRVWARDLAEEASFDPNAPVRRGDWRDYVERLDGPAVKLRTFVTEERPKSILTFNRSPDIFFDRSVNAYRGCEHGCVYCFARPTHAQRLVCEDYCPISCGCFEPVSMHTSQE